MLRYCSRLIIGSLWLFSGISLAQDSLHISRLGVLTGWVEANNVVIRDTLAFVVSEQGLDVISFANPGAPSVIGSLSSPGYCYGITLQGNHAYLGSPDTGVGVVDISDPEHPAEVGFFSTIPSIINGVAVNGDYVYAADFLAGLRIIDVTDPSDPTQLGLFSFPGQPVGILVQGTTAYLGAFGQGVRIVDVSGPATPIELGFYDTPGAAGDLALNFPLLYVADQNNGLEILDVSNSAVPTEVSSYETEEVTYSVEVSGDYAFIANSNDGLLVLNISDPENPQLAGYYHTTGRAFGVAVIDHYAILVGENHFGIYDCSAAIGTSAAHEQFTATHFSLHPVYPNPFNNTANITFDLPREVTGRLVVYDVLGREASTLYDGRLSAGSHQMQFNGANLSSGTYFFKLETPEFRASQKAVLLK